jgi:ACR3 family arsenite transporter
MLGLYAPTAVLLIGVSDIKLPWVTIIYAVLLFIAAPLAIAAVARRLIIKYVRNGTFYLLFSSSFVVWSLTRRMNGA